MWTSLWWAVSCGGWDQTIARSPLVGATPVDLRGQHEVLEVVPAGSYTYLRIADTPERWLVITGPAPTRGADVAWHGFAEAHDFRSGRLDRSFAHLWFASIDAGEGR